MTKTKQPRTGPDLEVAVVGSGFSGLCTAIKLREAGIASFAILEQDEVFGGTWRVNHYPGAACDVPSHLYSFSFAQNAEWTRKFPRQGELLAYTERLVRDYGLQAYLRLGTALLEAEFDEASGWWRLRTSRGELTARSLVLATGGLARVAHPKVPGLDTFQGPMFHSARWDHGVDLAGKRVAVIGTGASAIQFVPELAKVVAHLDLYQRTAPWVLPRPDRAITAVERWLLRRVQPLQWLYRGLHYARFESRFVAFARFPWILRAVEWSARRYIRKQIPHDAALCDKLTPSYRAGCKRLLLSNEYYPALARANVALRTEGIAEVRANSVLGRDGVERPVDAIVFGTGFDVEHALGGVVLRGRGGKLLSEAAQGGLQAYKGAAIPGFPNLFMIAGPNTGLGHNSIIYMIESGVRYVVQALQLLRTERLHALEVKAEVCSRYNERVQQRLRGTVWSSGCKSWYLTSGGKNVVLWPGHTFEYRRLTRRFDAGNYLRTAAPE